MSDQLRLELARPYARAVFEIAQSQKNLSDWENLLENLAFVASDKRVVKLLKNPFIETMALSTFFVEVCSVKERGGQAQALTKEQAQFISLLAERRRLDCLPQILWFYREFMDEANNQLPVTLYVASALKGSEEEIFQTRLNRYFNKEVRLTVKLQPSLLGGFLVQAKDKIIDRSIAGNITQLKMEMSE